MLGLFCLAGRFKLYFGDLHRFWPSVVRGWVGRRSMGGWGMRWQKLLKTVQRSSPVKIRTPVKTRTCTPVKTRTPAQSTGSCEAQWTPKWSRVQSQVSWCPIYTPLCQSHGVKSCPQNSRPSKYANWIHSATIAIEYSYNLGSRNNFHLWCKLGQ